MRCPACNHENTKVLDSRVSDQENSVRRRRECERCAFRFSTREEAEILDILVIKRNGSRENYSREKLQRGLMRALEKRPITKQEFKSLIAAVERDIYIRKQQEIKSADIGAIVMRHLKKLDKIAYIRFASVYRAFTDVSNFDEEIKKLIRKRTRGTKRAVLKRASRSSVRATSR